MLKKYDQLVLELTHTDKFAFRVEGRASPRFWLRERDRPTDDVDGPYNKLVKCLQLLYNNK